MSTLSCPHCHGSDWLPVVKIFLDVGLGRPPRPLVLEVDDTPDPAEVCFRCANGCVGITAAGEFVPTLGRVARQLDQDSDSMYIRDSSGA